MGVKDAYVSRLGVWSSLTIFVNCLVTAVSGTYKVGIGGAGVISTPFHFSVEVLLMFFEECTILIGLCVYFTLKV